MAILSKLCCSEGAGHIVPEISVYVLELGMQVGSHLFITMESGFNYTKWHLS